MLTTPVSFPLYSLDVFGRGRTVRAGRGSPEATFGTRALASDFRPLSDFCPDSLGCVPGPFYGNPPPPPGQSGPPSPGLHILRCRMAERKNIAGWRKPILRTPRLVLGQT